MARRNPFDTSNVTASTASRGRFGPRTDYQSVLFPERPLVGAPWQEWAAHEQDTVDLASQGYTGEAQRIRDETEGRRDERLAFLTDEQQRASQPTIQDSDINRMYGKAADTAAVDAQALMRSLREQMGQSGVSGGTAAGIGAQVELQRLGQMTDARRDLRIYKANADAQDRINRYQRAFGIGEVIGQEPSPFMADALANLAGLRLYQQELGINGRLGVRAAEAAEGAQGEWWQQALGMGLGAVTSFL